MVVLTGNNILDDIRVASFDFNTRWLIGGNLEHHGVDLNERSDEQERNCQGLFSHPISILDLLYNFMSYWDIQSFLAQEQPALFRFTEDAEGMAFIDTSKGMTGTVPAQSPLNAPIWVVSTLRDYVFKPDAELIRVEVPKFLQRDQNEGYYKSLQTDRSANFQSLNLKQKSAYFYQIYQSLHKTLENNKNLIEIRQIKTMLLDRGSCIIERASTHQQESKAEAKFNNYIELERQVFRTIRSKTQEYERWECRNI